MKLHIPLEKRAWFDYECRTVWGRAYEKPFLFSSIRKIGKGANGESWRAPISPDNPYEGFRLGFRIWGGWR